MKKIKIVLTVLLIGFIASIQSNAQTCFELGADLSGIDRSNYPLSLNNIACLIDDDIPNGEFKAFDFGFYLITSQAIGGVENSLNVARNSIGTVPYYLLVARVPSSQKLVDRIIVETKLPDDGIFECLTPTLREIIDLRIKTKISAQFTVLGESPFQYGIALESGLQELYNIIQNLKVGNCCLTEQDQIEELLLAEGFHEIFGGIIDEPALRPKDEVVQKRSSTIDDYTNFDIGLEGKLQSEIDNLGSKGFSGHGFITGDMNFCDNMFDQAKSDFESSSSDFNIWYHVLTDSETGEYRLFEKIDKYDNYLESTTLSEASYQDGPCGAALWGNTENDCDEPCHGTKRPGRCGTSWIYGNIEHWLIEIDYVCNLNVIGNSLAEYMIPNSGANGGPGYADMVDLGTGEIFEIKSENVAANGVAEVENYIAKGILHCPNTSTWKKGTFYPVQRVLPNPRNPSQSLVVQLYEAGVLSYSSENLDIDPEPVIVPQHVFERIKRFMERMKQSIETIDIELEVARFLHENPEVATFIKGAAIGAGIAIIVGTIIEDFVTLGGGIADDWASFYLAYRLVRIAMI